MRKLPQYSTPPKRTPLRRSKPSPHLPPKLLPQTPSLYLPTEELNRREVVLTNEIQRIDLALAKQYREMEYQNGFLFMEGVNEQLITGWGEMMRMVSELVVRGVEVGEKQMRKKSDGLERMVKEGEVHREGIEERGRRWNFSGKLVKSLQMEASRKSRAKTETKEKKGRYSPVRSEDKQMKYMQGSYV